MSKKPYEEEPRANPATRPAAATGQWLFGGFAFALALFLFVSIPFQASYFDNVPWFKQPRTWPAIAIIGMLITGIGHFINLRKFQEEENALPFNEDLYLFFGAVEVSAYFIIYIYFVGLLGYLPSNILFALFMTWRMGYNQFRFYLYAVLMAIAIVIIFKGFLQVKIPGGAAYDRLPETIQAFAKTYL